MEKIVESQIFLRKILKKYLQMKKNAFSLVEISIVIVVISILIAGIMEGRILVKKAKVSEAKTQTVNSPVANIGGLLLWYETTLEESFESSEAKDDNIISTWYDLNPNVDTVKNNATQSTASNRPKYKTNRINGLPAISFTRANSNFLAFDGTGIANSAFTIFIVEQRTSNDSPNSFFGGTSTENNSNLSFAYQNESIVIDQNNNGLSKTIFSTYTIPTPRIHSFTFNFSTKNYFVNGLEMSLTGTGSSYDITKPLAAFIGASLGANRKAGSEKYFQGDIGEVIIFKKALSTDDRKEVEKYLGKKWSIKTYSETSGSCNGIINGSGCLTSCLVDITGITSPSSVVGPSSGTFFCKTPEYNDSIPYTCSSSGILDLGGQACDVCAAGYSYYGGICQASCSIFGISGIINGTSVAAGPNTVTCNDTANNFTGTVAGVCSGGTFTPNSGQACQGPCSISGIAGITSGTSVLPGANTVTCNDTANNFTGTVAGVCSNGTFTPNSGQACTCTSGYYLSSGSCVAQCEGGVITTYTDGGVTRSVHTFTNVITVVTNLEFFRCPTARNINILVVGGGGAGSEFYDGGGGGGGGGVVHAQSIAISGSTKYDITVGGGANYNNSCSGSNGGDSKFGTIITAKGGGGGGGSPCSGAAGGSGGGGGRDSRANSGGAISANTFPSGATSYGNKGGGSGSSWSGGGGGGGAGNTGGNGSGGSASAEKGGTGGPGVQISISGLSPTPYYGAGGGGGVNGSSYVSPGGSFGNTGAGGNGGARGYSTTTVIPRSIAATNGADGYGSGGGGSHPSAPGNPGKGGSGVVIISYP